MEVILSGILGVMIGILLTSLFATAKISDLTWERDDYRQRLINEKLKTEQRDILLRDILKEPVKTDKSTTNS
jgi:hypothetical protein